MSQVSHSGGMRWNLRRSVKYNQEVVKGTFSHNYWFLHIQNVLLSVITRL